jgi:molybdenum ABC transporter molybdate-binding protein
LAVGGSLLAAGVLVALMHQQAAQEGPRAGTELVLYCAAGLRKPVEEAGREYERRYGVRVRVASYNGSGTLLGQLRKLDTPGDLFLAGEREYLDAAKAEGLVEEVLPVATMTPVIAVRPGNPKKIQGLADLLRPDVTVSIANPKAAAVGKVTKRVLEKQGLWAQFTARRDVSEQGTVTEAANNVHLETSDAAVVWDATARQTGLEIVRDPALTRAADEAAIGVLRRSEHPTEALRFARFLTARDRGGELFAKHHFGTIADADQWAEAPEVVVYAGAMLRPAIDDTLRRFAEREGVQLKTVYNGCGILTSTIKQQQDRVDVYFACDTAFLDPVQDLFEPGRVFSQNPLVLITPKDNPHHLRTLEDLTKPGVRLGLAHPDKSALGVVALKLLRQRGLYERVKKNLETDAATGDFLVNQVRLGALDAAIVYRSNALATPRNVAEHLDVIELGTDVQATQPFTIARNTAYRQLARRLEAALAAPASRERFRHLGFTWAHGDGK